MNRQTHKRYHLTNISSLVSTTPPCPNCDAKLDSVFAVSRDPILMKSDPHPGDFTVCVYCAAWLVFTDMMSLRWVNANDILTMDVTIHIMLSTITKGIKRAHEEQK